MDYISMMLTFKCKLYPFCERLLLEVLAKSVWLSYVTVHLLILMTPLAWGPWQLPGLPVLLWQPWVYSRTWCWQNLQWIFKGLVCNNWTFWMSLLRLNFFIYLFSTFPWTYGWNELTMNFQSLGSLNIQVILWSERHSKPVLPMLSENDVCTVISSTYTVGVV